MFRQGHGFKERFREIQSVAVRVRKIAGGGEPKAGPGDVLWADGRAVGSPTNMGVISWRMKQFWDDEMGPCWMNIDGKIGCASSSAGGWRGGMELACHSVLTMPMNYEFVVFGVTDYVFPRLDPALRAAVGEGPVGRPGQGGL